MANWEELPEDVKKSLVKNKQVHMYAAIAAVFFLVMDGIVLFQQLGQATGTQ